MADDDDDGVVVTVVVVRRCATHGFHVGGRKCVEQMQRTWTETESESVFFGSAGSYRKKIVRDISCPMSQSTFHHNLWTEVAT